MPLTNRGPYGLALARGADTGRVSASPRGRPVGVDSAAPRIRGLDGLRAIAVLLVIGLHTWRPFIPGGAIGVSLFFVLSGYLITELLTRERAHHGRIALRDFYARRCLRLGPALVPFLIAAALFSVTVAATDVGATTRSGILAALAYMSSWGRALDANQTYGALGHTWSLSIEEQFYLLWPLLLIAILRWRSARWGLAICVGAVAAVWAWRTGLQLTGAPAARVAFGIDTRGDLLLAGCGLALARHSGLLAKLPPRLLRLAGAAGLLYLCVFAAAAPDPAPLTWSDYPVQTVALAALLASVTQGPPAWLLCVLELRPLRALGTISYGCYLWHYLIWTALSPALAPGPVALAAVLALTLVAATVSYVVVERPAHRLRRRFAARPGAVPARIPVPVSSAPDRIPVRAA
jgi:peptidoglycan/LPS O-acetylase OafA/YrhL